MTTIAWKQGQLAVDRQLTDGSLATEADKLFVGKKVAIACAGDYEEGEQFKEWYLKPDGKCPLKETEALIMDLDTGDCYFWEARAKRQRKVGEEIDALEVMGLSPIKYLVVPKFMAIGSGAGLALGALEAGASLKRALKIASKRDSGTGLGIDMVRAKR